MMIPKAPPKDEKKLTDINQKKQEKEAEEQAELKRIENNIVDYFKMEARVRWAYYIELREQGFDREQAMELVREAQILEDEEY